jgi:hypothetical protein
LEKYKDIIKGYAGLNPNKVLEKYKDIIKGYAGLNLNKVLEKYKDIIKGYAGLNPIDDIFIFLQYFIRIKTSVTFDDIFKFLQLSTLLRLRPAEPLMIS